MVKVGPAVKVVAGGGFDDNDGMYFLATQFKNLPVMSLQTGESIATLGEPIIKMSDLEVMAVRCRVTRNRQDGVILMRDIRQLAPDCVIIDSFDEIGDIEDIVRLKEVAAQSFNPIGSAVINESGHKLGRVEDYTVNLKTSMLQKLYVHQSLMKSILFNSLTIDRTQITDVTPRQFTVRDATAKVSTLLTKPFSAGTPTKS